MTAMKVYKLVLPFHAAAEPILVLRRTHSLAIHGICFESAPGAGVAISGAVQRQNQAPP